MLFYYIALGLILTRIPFIGKYFRLYTTFIHEMGHAIMALLTRGKVYQIHINPDTSGLAFTGTRGRVSRILVSIIGYPFSIIISVVMLKMVYEGNSRSVLIGVIFFMAIGTFFWVRNNFGFVWAHISIAISLVLLFYTNPTMIDIYVKTMVGIVFVESILTTIVLFKITLRNKEQATDSKNLREATGIPEIVWSTLFLVFAVYMSYYSFPMWF